MRCKILHQGYAETTQRAATRYTNFSFGQPDQNGKKDHMRVVGTTLHLDVDDLATEMRNGVNGWIAALEANSTQAEAQHVAQNLPSLVKVTPVISVGPLGQQYTNFKTN